jgi:hypothetical protein
MKSRSRPKVINKSRTESSEQTVIDSEECTGDEIYSKWRYGVISAREQSIQTCDGDSRVSTTTLDTAITAITIRDYVEAYKET